MRKNGRPRPADAGHGPFLRSVLAAQLFGPSVMGVVVPDRCQVAVKAEPELASGPTPSSEMNSVSTTLVIVSSCPWLLSPSTRTGHAGIDTSAERTSGSGLSSGGWIH